MTTPLDGIRVVEMTSVVLGPYACQMLGDLGADVIKIEPPAGDTNRNLGPRRNSQDMGSLFLTCNRNKRSVALDLKSDRGRKAALDIIKTADVVVHNFRPQAMLRLGLDYEAVRQVNSNIVYCATYGYSKKGPYGDKGALDDSIQAASGIAVLQSMVEGEPRYLPTIIADKTTGQIVVQAVLAALFHRERTGEGQHIKLSMLDATVAFFWPEGMQGLTFAEKETDVRKTFSSIDLIYETQNGYITISVISDKEWKGICVALNCEELISDKRFVTSLARRRNSEERRAVIGDLVERWTSEEILEELDKNDVPCAPLLDRTELMDHPQLLASKTVEKIEFEGFGEVRQAKPAAEFSLTQSEIRKAAPKLGQHSVEILQALGYDRNNLDQLLKAEVIFQNS